MPRGRGYGGRPASRATRLSKAWGRTNPVGAVASATPQAEMLSCTLAEQGLGENTILRTRGAYLIAATPNAATDVDVVGLGITVVPETTRAIGGASLPGPIADEGADFWLWHQYVALDAITASAGDPQAISLVFRGEIDSKAMRKLPNDSAVVLIGESSNGTMADIAFSGGLAFLVGQ